MTIATNPISKHYKGLPCMLGEMVCRIVGEDEISTWGYINGERVPSIPIVCTPHGSIIMSGRFYLSEITEEGLQKLKDYETELEKEGKEMYGGKLTKVEINNL